MPPFRIFPKANLSMLALSTNCIVTCYIQIFSKATPSMLPLITNRTCKLLNSQLPYVYPLNAHSQYELYLLSDNIHNFPTATLSMLTFSTNCTCYLLTSHIPNSYHFDAHTQYLLYLLTVTFTTSKQLHTQCSLSAPTLPYTFTSS